MEASEIVVHEGAEHRPPRRRLAPNVVCMFDHDRDRVTSPRWYGRYPRMVVRMARWRLIAPGDVVLIVKGSLNVGKRLRIVRADDGAGLDACGGPYWFAESLDGLLWTAGGEGMPHEQGTECFIGAPFFRKVGRAAKS